MWEDDQPQPHPDDLPKGSFGNIWQAQSTIVSAVRTPLCAARMLDVLWPAIDTAKGSRIVCLKSLMDSHKSGGLKPCSTQP